MALATIVAVRGSTYRRPGARLLVPEDGAPVGNISGGCLEGDVADMARIVMEEGTARLAGWDLTADDDAVWGLGLGCNGAIEVFIEPAEQAAQVAGALRMALEEERAISVVTVLESAHHGHRARRAPGRAAAGRSRGLAGIRRGRRRRAGRRPRAARPGEVRDPHAAGRHPRLRRGAGPAAPSAGLRRRPRRHPHGAHGRGPGMERHRRGRSPGVPHVRTVSGRGGLRPRGGPRGRGEDRAHRRPHLRRGDDPQLPARQGVPAGAPELAGLLHRDAGPGRAHRAPADGAPRRRGPRSAMPTGRASTVPPAWIWAARAPRRSPSRSRRRSWRSATRAPEGS